MESLSLGEGQRIVWDQDVPFSRKPQGMEQGGPGAGPSPLTVPGDTVGLPGVPWDRAPG